LKEDLSREEFVRSIAEMFSRFNHVLVIEDDHPGFKAGRGLVGLIGIRTDGWSFLPECLFFKWARRRNILRAAVGFFQMLRYQKDVGVCEVRTTKKDFAYMKHMEKYGVLYMRGKIPSGSRDGDVFVFSINGKKE
jgi:hypothetical protein